MSDGLLTMEAFRPNDHRDGRLPCDGDADAHRSDRDLDHISLAPDTAGESAERYVLALISWGELGPRARLPPATELAARLGSRA